MPAQVARCTLHVAKEFSFTGGNRRPRRITNPVARAQGRKEKAEVKNSRTQAWCMPSDRMTNTVCVAAISPKPDQIAAIHIQPCACERVGLVSIGRWYSTAPAAKQGCSESPELCSRRSGPQDCS